MKKKALVLVLMFLLLLVAAACSVDSVVQVNTPAPTSVVRVNTPVPNPPAGTPAPNNGQINLPGVTIQVYAPGPNPLLNTSDAHGRPAGFWLGLWHGIISPVTIILEFLHQNAQMYEVHNDGSPYNFGFFLGVFLFPVVLGLLIGRR